MAGKRILLFDVDGTLTKPRNKITEAMKTFLNEMRKVVPIAVVGGSDYVKVIEQLGNSGEEVLSRFDYVFTENGLVAYKGNESLGSQRIQDAIGEQKLQKFINHCMKYMADIVLPLKRGHFFEFRRGMINISPIGRLCSQQERDEFVVFDAQQNIRQKMVDNLNANFPRQEYNLQFSIGGQISIDVFPVGWDKTYCLQYLTKDNFTDIHFFGDKTDPGGNDHEIYDSSQTVGHKVSSPEDTMQKVKTLMQI